MKGRVGEDYGKIFLDLVIVEISFFIYKKIFIDYGFKKVCKANMNKMKL